jgi:hypothetical protein
MDATNHNAKFPLHNTFPDEQVPTNHRQMVDPGLDYNMYRKGLQEPLCQKAPQRLRLNTYS